MPELTSDLYEEALVIARSEPKLRALLAELDAANLVLERAEAEVERAQADAWRERVRYVQIEESVAAFVAEKVEERDAPCTHSPAAWRSCERCSDAEGDMRYDEERGK